MKKLITITVAVMILQGCATSYQKDGFFSLSGGYSETQLDKNVFKVSFSGNGFTSRERATNLTLLRSAELTLENGYQYFAIIEANSYTSNSAYTTPATYNTTGRYDSGGYSATTTKKGGQTYNISRPSTSNTIVCFKEKPETIFTYNASFIHKSIKAKYRITDVAK